MSNKRKNQSPEEQILQLAKTQGAIRPRDLEEMNIARSWVYRLCDQGLLVREARGGVLRSKLYVD
jgi:hypothetical protein